MFHLTRRAFLGAAVCPAVFAGRQSDQLRLSDTRGAKVAFLYGQRVLFEYQYARSLPKPYVHPISAANGRLLTLAAPPDHLHHRGLMLGWSNVNNRDFWGEPGSTRGPHGLIVHQRFEKLHENSGSLTAVNHWIADERVLLVERRTLRAHAPSRDTVMMDWISELNPVAGEVVLKAAKGGYDGLGLRLARSFDGGGILNSLGTNAIEGANGEAADWCAYYGQFEGGGLGGAAILNHSSNPRHPTPFYVANRKFAYLSAAPTFHDPFRLGQGQTLRLAYRIVVFVGEAEKSTLDTAFNQWKSQRVSS